MNADKTACASSGKATAWDQIDWLKCERQVRRLQARIVKATQEAGPIHEVVLGSRDSQGCRWWSALPAANIVDGSADAVKSPQTGLIGSDGSSRKKSPEPGSS